MNISKQNDTEYSSVIDKLSCNTYQMQNCVDDLPIGHLPDLNEADEDGEFQIVGGCHSDDFVGPLDLTIRRTHDVRHFVDRWLLSTIVIAVVGFL